MKYQMFDWAIESYDKDELEHFKNKKGVYFLYNDNGLVYVGETDNLHRRLKHHTVKWKWFSFIEIDGWRKNVERSFIELLEPRYNMHKRPHLIPYCEKCRKYHYTTTFCHSFNRKDYILYKGNSAVQEEAYEAFK